MGRGQAVLAVADAHVTVHVGEAHGRTAGFDPALGQASAELARSAQTGLRRSAFRG